MLLVTHPDEATAVARTAVGSRPTSKVSWRSWRRCSTGLRWARVIWSSSLAKPRGTRRCLRRSCGRRAKPLERGQRQCRSLTRLGTWGRACARVEVSVASRQSIAPWRSPSERFWLSSALASTRSTTSSTPTTAPQLAVDICLGRISDEPAVVASRLVKVGDHCVRGTQPLPVVVDPRAAGQVHG
jgi:hypothetical protein